MKLGIGDIIQSAALSLWRGGWPLAICLILWAGAESAYAYLGNTLDPAGKLIFSGAIPALMDFQSLKSGALLALREMVDRGLRDLFGCLFVAATLRIILIGTVGLRGAEFGGLGRATVGILLVGLAMTVALNAPFLLVYGFVDINSEDGWSGLVAIGAPLVFAVMVMYLTARLCLIYPSLAVGQGLGVARNWRRTADNGIRLAALFAMVFIAVGAVETFLDLVFFGAPIEATDLGWLVIGHSAKKVVLSVLTGAVVLALSAVVFARLTGFPAAGVPGAHKTPAQLAEAFE